MPLALGVDFSGGAGPWRHFISNPMVWIATLAWDDGARLIDHLRRADYEVAAIDAPFSLAAAHLPTRGRSALLERVLRLPNGKKPAVCDRPKPHRACRSGAQEGFGQAVAAL